MSKDKVTKGKEAPAKAKASGQGAKGKEVSQEVLDTHGVLSLIKMGQNAEAERVSKNRIIFFLSGALCFSLAWNAIQSSHQPEPKLLGETTDGRIRPLPLLSEPMYTSKEILGWAEKCVSTIYNLSYVDWQTKIRNDTQCLSDASQQNFAGSLDKIGLLKYLNKDAQGTIYAVPGQAVLKKSWLSEKGYNQWVVEVPYRIAVDGKQRGSLNVRMVMNIRRVSLTWRDAGIWIEDYMVVPDKGA